MSATPADDAQTSPAWNCGCKDTIIFGEMQIKIAFWGDFLLRRADFSRVEPQSAPQNATSVSGTPLDNEQRKARSASLENGASAYSLEVKGGRVLGMYAEN